MKTALHLASKYIGSSPSQSTLLRRDLSVVQRYVLDNTFLYLHNARILFSRPSVLDSQIVFRQPLRYAPDPAKNVAGNHSCNRFRTVAAAVSATASGTLQR